MLFLVCNINWMIKQIFGLMFKFWLRYLVKPPKSVVFFKGTLIDIFFLYKCEMNSEKEKKTG